MLNKLQIFNMALERLGEHTISNADSTTDKTAIKLNVFYDTCRKSLMKEFEFPFLTTEVKLTRETITKTVGTETVEVEYNKDFPFIFNIPDDCVNIEKLFIGTIKDDLGDKYKSNYSKHYIELKKGKDWDYRYITEKSAPKIICKFKDNICAEYTKDITDTTIYQAVFDDMLSMKLATEVCISITKSTEKLSALLQLYNEKKKNAIMLLANEVGTIRKDFIPNSIRARAGILSRRDLI